MSTRAHKTAVQTCPNCLAVHDTAVYVSGQRVRCKCGIHFEVRRTDVAGGRTTQLPTVMLRRGQGENPEASLEPQEVDFGPTVTPPSRKSHGEAQSESTYIASAERVLLPGYELQEILGRGGMGNVWRAHQTSLGRVVAVKILPPHLAKDPEFVVRFEKEATALASLSHPNIIQIIDRGVAGGHYYFAMELVEGRSLRELLSGGPLPMAQAVSLVVQILKAIDHAHQKQIIHRDLKPENILVDERAHVKVADFGLAGIRGSEAKLQLTATSVAMGTVNYMAPEQRRDAKNVDGRADLYSVGVILYELLTGELPIGRFKLPSEKVPHVDRRIDEVVSKALEPEPDARYSTASEIGMELEQVLGSGSDLTLPGRPMTAPAKPRAMGQRASSVIERGWSGLKVGLMVVGLVSAVGAAVRVLPDWWTTPSPPIPARPLPANTYDELFVGLTETQLVSGQTELRFSFDEGEEELNAHAGSWWLETGQLRGLQAGTEVGEGVLKLVPRTYAAHRYFSTDDFTAETEMEVVRLAPGYPVEANAQSFAELALRIKDLQVSAFAIPDSGMRLGWRYFTEDGIEISGNSSRDLETMVEDEMPVPKGRFRVKLALRRVRNAIDVEAFVNGQRFAHKTLVGLQGQTGKLAVGCRNLGCTFSDLVVRGKAVSRPNQQKVE